MGLSLEVKGTFPVIVPEFRSQEANGLFNAPSQNLVRTRRANVSDFTLGREETLTDGLEEGTAKFGVEMGIKAVEEGFVVDGGVGEEGGPSSPRAVLIFVGLFRPAEEDDISAASVEKTQKQISGGIGHIVKLAGIWSGRKQKGSSLVWSPKGGADGIERWQHCFERQGCAGSGWRCQHRGMWKQAWKKLRKTIVGLRGRSWIYVTNPQHWNCRSVLKYC